MGRPRSTEADFWSKVDRNGPVHPTLGTACWVWTKGKTAFGYGQFMIARRATAAHRLAWELTHGAVPPARCVLHRCDNPPCCNPDHLFLGTRADNNADMVAKGRHRSVTGRFTGTRGTQRLCGTQNPHARLTDDGVREIRALRAQGARIREIAARYGVAEITVHKILSGERWRHVE